VSKIGNAFPTDPLAKALGLGKNLLPNSGTPGLGNKSTPSAIDSAPIPTPASPIGSAAAEVIAAEQDLAKQNLMKKSVKKTIFAGDTGGYAYGVAAPTGYKAK
jgi:hypothetical protein